MSRARDTESRREFMRKYQDKKKRYEKTRPLLMNYIPYNSEDLERLEIDDLVLYVTNLLSRNDDMEHSQICNLAGLVGHEMIDAIMCPDCGETIYRHEYWDCYICFCEGVKKIYDIMKIDSVKIKLHEKQLDDIRSLKIIKLRTRS